MTPFYEAHNEVMKRFRESARNQTNKKRALSAEIKRMSNEAALGISAAENGRLTAIARARNVASNL